MAWSFRVLVCNRSIAAAALAAACLVANPTSCVQAQDAGSASAPDNESGARGEDAFRQALLRLKSPLASERATAADELGKRGFRFRVQISAALRPLLVSDPESVVRAAAGRALGRLGVRDAVPELLKALEDKAVEVRVVAAAALWRLPDASAVPALMVHAQDVDHTVREWSALALGVAADPRAVPVLVRLLADPERAVRLAAVRSLGRIDKPEGIDALTTYLQTGKRDDEEKDEVINALVGIPSGDREQALLRVLALAGADTRQRVRVSLALGKIGDADVIPPLRKLMTRDREASVRSAAKQALVLVQERLQSATHASAVDAARP